MSDLNKSEAEKKKSSAKKEKVNSTYPCYGELLYWSVNEDKFRLNLLSTSSNYEAKKVELMLIDGKFWHSQKKCWYFPKAAFRALVAYCQKWKISPTTEAKEKVIKFYNEEKEAFLKSQKEKQKVGAVQ